MLLSEGTWLAGSISGGCIEADLIDTAWDRTASGPVLVTYDASSPEDAIFGFGLGCNGVAQVLVQRLPEDGGPLASLEKLLQDRKPVEIATAISPGSRLGQIWNRHGELPGDCEYLFERLEPPQSLLVFGAGQDAIPLIAFAKSLGWFAVVVDSRSSMATRDRFPLADHVVVAAPNSAASFEFFEPNSAVVLMTHSYSKDLELLKQIGESHPCYLGILGPRARTQRLLEDAGFPDLEVHGPIGLDLGAIGPEEIALSVTAEILAKTRSRSGGSLRTPLVGARSETL